MKWNVEGPKEKVPGICLAGGIKPAWREVWFQLSSK